MFVKVYFKVLNIIIDRRVFFSFTLFAMFKGVLRSRNYLFSAPPLSIFAALALATGTDPAIFCHFKLYYNNSTIRIMSQWRFFVLASSKVTKLNIYLKDISCSWSQIILDPPAPQSRFKGTVQPDFRPSVTFFI